VAERTPSAAALTRRAVERIQDGEIADARHILAEALDVDPQYESAWLWFAHIAEDPGERRFCLEQAAAANPDSRAKQDLAKLKRVAAIEPPEVADLVPPPLPPSVVADARRGGRLRGAGRRAAGADLRCPRRQRDRRHAGYPN
jgi:hypothetical protein